jgi:hypothetical protein
LSPDVGSNSQGGGEPKSTGRNPSLVLMWQQHSFLASLPC